MTDADDVPFLSDCDADVAESFVVSDYVPDCPILLMLMRLR